MSDGSRELAETMRLRVALMRRWGHHRRDGHTPERLLHGLAEDALAALRLVRYHRMSEKVRADVLEARLVRLEYALARTRLTLLWTLLGVFGLLLALAAAYR